MAMLEATPLMGRLLEPREEAAGLDRVAVISYSMWQRRLGADDAILGKTIVLDGIQYEVVGVMRPGFQFPNADAEFWTPVVWGPGQRSRVVGRLTAGASFLTASTEVNDLMRLAREERRSAGGPRRASLRQDPVLGPSSLYRRLRQGPVALRRLRQDQVQDRHLHRAGARARAMAPSVRSRSRRGSSSSPCAVSIRPARKRPS